MRLLIDSHALIWFVDQHQQLSLASLAAICAIFLVSPREFPQYTDSTFQKATDCVMARYLKRVSLATIAR